MKYDQAKEKAKAKRRRERIMSMRKRGMTQQEVADKLRISRARVQYLEALAKKDS